jgi:hypothetical protein
MVLASVLVNVSPMVLGGHAIEVPSITLLRYVLDASSTYIEVEN